MRRTSLASHRAHSALLRSLNARVRLNLALVVSNRRLRDRADVIRASFQHIRVVRRENGGRSADDRAEGIVELLRLGLIDGGLEGGAGGRFG